MLSRRFLTGLNALFDRIENSFRFNDYFQSSTIVFFFFSSPKYLNSNIEKSLLKLFSILKDKKKNRCMFENSLNMCVTKNYFFFSRIVCKVFHAQTIWWLGINGEFFPDISRFVSLARLSCIVEDKSGASCVQIGQTACIIRES